jgi:hypothetical protein
MCSFNKCILVLIKLLCGQIESLWGAASRRDDNPRARNTDASDIAEKLAISTALYFIRLNVLLRLQTL